MWVLSPKNKQDYFLKCSHLLWGLQSSERQALWAGRLPPSLLPSLVCHPGVGRGCEGPAPASPPGGGEIAGLPPGGCGWALPWDLWDLGHE